MKATSGWNDDGNGTDDYGFSALPGGDRYYDGGLFNNMGDYGGWWSSTEYDDAYAWYRIMSDYYGNVYRDYYYKRHGFSVRCVRD
ncbi:MAG: hypothetical protein GX467_07550 [Rikenellaceae bacterium]|nr:hypothetical protein [Bacteroidales bacterium]NLH56696.1 hypothetical protein [Rikenellaceae bacterium]OQC62991.1 MAG: hypothetical protein BWX49_01455 [Bacteroidetes bacterium ADurb.Bin008]